MMSTPHLGPRLVSRFPPQPIPLPDPPPNVGRYPVPQLMRQHQNLPAMMRLVRKHVRKHRPAGRPHRSPTTPAKFRHPPLRPAGQCIPQHAQTLLCTLLMCHSSLLHRAPVRIQRRRTLQMRRRVPNPYQSAVVQVRKDRRNRPPAPWPPGRPRPPGPLIEVRQQMLIHRIVDRVSLDQNSGKFFLRIADCIFTRPSSHTRNLPATVILSLAFAEAKQRQTRSRRIPAYSARHTTSKGVFRLAQDFDWPRICYTWKARSGGTSDNSLPLQ